MCKENVQEINKFLTEAISSCSRDEGVFRSSGYLCCVKCNQIIDRGLTPCIGIVDFFTWNGFGNLWKWSQKQEWNYDLIKLLESEQQSYNHKWLNPEKFALAVYKYLKGIEHD